MLCSETVIPQSVSYTSSQAASLHGLGASNLPYRPRRSESKAYARRGLWEALIYSQLVRSNLGL